MCEPVTIMAAASLAVGAYSANQARKARLAGNQQAAQWGQEDFSQAVSDARVLQSQISGDAAAQESARVREARQEASTIATIAGEYGSGNTSDRLQNEAAIAAAEDVGAIRTNRDRQLAEVSKDVTKAQTDLRRGVQRNTVGGSAARMGMYAGLAGTALSIGSQYNATRPISPASAKPRPISYGYTG